MLSEKHSEDALAQICEHHKVIGQQKAIIGFSYLDDDHDAGDLTKMNEFMDAHGLLLELQEEMAEIVNKDHTHIGIGFAADKHMVMIVELFSSRALLVNNLNHTEDGGIEVQGFNLKPTEAGIYAARIVNPANTKKDYGLVGPSRINYDPAKHTFTINFDPPPNGEEVFYSQEQKILEIYVRKAQIDKIKYGADADPSEKIKVE